MFPQQWILYVKIGLCALLLLGAGYTGYSIEASRFERYKVEQLAQTQKAEQEHQALADQIRKDKDAQIASINNSLADALVQLRSRPSRAQAPSDGQGGTGLSLSAEDATFLDREAARADILRTALDACYKQYDSIK
jgi:hypothetical protein